MSQVTNETSSIPLPPAHDPQAEQADFAELWCPDDKDQLRGPQRILLEDGLVTEEQISEAVECQHGNPHMTVLDALVDTDAIDEMAAFGAIATYFQLPFMRIVPEDIDENVFELLPISYLKDKRVIPIRKEGQQMLVGLTNPADIFLIDDLKRRLDAQPQLIVVPPGDIYAAIDALSVSPAQQVDEIIKGISEDAVEVVTKRDDDVADLEKIAGESPVIRYVNYVIASAVRDEVSDIHIEPRENSLAVRWRIDGILFEQPAPPKKLHAAIISRLKIMANLDIAERRLPQDGRIRASIHGQHVDLRISILSTTHGEKCVIRILDNRSIMVGLENLGMLNDTLTKFRRNILLPHGVVLVTGPTGSGKSTTLYSALQVMDSKGMNISTVEDPVEYELDGINQVHVHESIGMTFSAALRSLLRQDPDIVMIGEIRDEETARIAVQASLTGHLVLTTLHTNDAPSSITRLVNIGVEPYLIGASVRAVLAQRLVRRICENCKTLVSTIPDNIARYMERHDYQIDQLYQGAGCDKCRQTGFKGRVGIYELMEVDDDIRDVITNNLPLNEFRRIASEKGMRTLRQDGLEKITTGMTTIDELVRVTEV